MAWWDRGPRSSFGRCHNDRMSVSDFVPILLASTVLSAAVAGAISLISQAMNLRFQSREISNRTKDLERQRVRENSEFMMSLIAIAHGTPSDGRRNLALAEQVAAVELIVSNANEYPELRKPTEVFLRSGMDYARAKSGASGETGGWAEMLERYSEAFARLNRLPPQ